MLIMQEIGGSAWKYGLDGTITERTADAARLSQRYQKR